MPGLPATHKRTTANARPFQVKKNNAAIAPIWNAIMKNEVVQLTGSENVLSRSMRFMTPNLARASEDFCNSCVIPLLKFLKILRQKFLDSPHLLPPTCTNGQLSSRYVAAAPRGLLHIYGSTCESLVASRASSHRVPLEQPSIRNGTNRLRRAGKLPWIRKCMLRSLLLSRLTL